MVPGGCLAGSDKVPRPLAGALDTANDPSVDRDLIVKLGHCEIYWLGA